jgi:V8-like Glu-specific endopeptidase
MRKLHSILCALAAAALPLQAQDVARPALLGGELTKTYPYSMAGQLIFTSGDTDFQGSATVIFKRSVVTAAHNMWDPDNGWSTNVEFNRARDGEQIATRSFATRLFVMGGYQGGAARFGANSLRAFAYDLGGMRFALPLADGSYAGWRADVSLLKGDAYNVALGYGADRHSGDEMLFVEPFLSFYQTYSAFFENDSLTFEGGMSGGPVFAETDSGEMRLVAVIVAGSDDPPGGGIRALTLPAARFIATYLHY